MTIHGIRIYPQSVSVVQGIDSKIFVHGRLSSEISDFEYIFHPLTLQWGGKFIAAEFPMSAAAGGIEDPMPRLRERFGGRLYGADRDSQIMLLHEADGASWASILSSLDCGFVPVFREPPTFELLNQLYWDRNFQLTSETWPYELRAVLHNWDGVFWQLFTSDPEDITALCASRANDPKLRMFWVELEREYPNPSNQELQPVQPRDKQP